MHHRVDWLGPGHLLVRRPDAAGWVLHAPNGGVLDVDTSLVPGTSTPSELGSPAVVDAFAAAGFGASDVEPSVKLLSNATVMLLGDQHDRLLGALRSRLTEAGVRIDVAAPERVAAVLACPSAGSGKQVVVACSDAPASDEWLRWEQLLPTPSAWMRVSVEGAHAYLEPPSSDASGVTHQMVRARRLAASPWPVEQRGLWRDDLLAGQSLLGQGAAEMLADLVVADIVEYLRAAPGDRPAFGRTLRVLDLHTLQLTAHPVLPVPPTTQWRDS